MRRILSILITLLLSLTVMAQRYSVTVTPVLLPPYTLNLSELTAQGSAKMMATLTVNDLTASNLPVRLHFKLESSGVTIESIPTSAVAPLFLNGGETQVLTGSDMAQYLRLDNLEFRGYSKDTYRQTGQLPGGLWKVTVEVRHFNTGRVLSNRGSAIVWVSIYDPPVLTAPRNNTEAPDNASLPLVFSWQASKHTGGTVAVQYKLELWEMRMEGVPAQTVAASMKPLFETTTSATSHTAIPTIMNLEPGIRYCWRVTVFDPSGQAQINKNGQSEVREFTYLHTCPAVDEVTAAVRNTQADFSWTPSPYHTHFQVEMFQEGGSSDVNDCYDSKFRLYDFPQGTTWRVRVRGECKGDLEADWSPWTDFSIDPPGTPPTSEECPDCGCDDGPAKREIENYELKELQPGDTIVNRTGRTRFIVLSANATGEHIYSGQFYLWLELWRTKVRCDYTDLKVNTDGVILDGSWRSVHNDGLMVNPATVAENIQNIREGIANATFDNSIDKTIKLGYAVQTIYKDENGRYIAILEDGSEHDLTQDLQNNPKTLVEDSKGNKMVVTSDQQVMSAEQYHNTGKNNTLIKNDNERKDKQIAAGEVVFKPSGNQQYGFDAYDASTNNHSEIYPALEGGYRPAYKSVAQWKQDNVKAEPMDGVTFRSQMGTPYAITNGEVILRGEPQPGETPVYAHVAETDSTTKVVGKLNLLTFEPKEISVCLVPVNGATLPNTQTIEKELNKIFKPAVASVKLSTHSGVTISYANNSEFVHGGSGLLSVYSDDEKAAINALTDADDDTYYLFLVNSVTKLDADGNRTIVSGYMPVGYQHGFIFEQFDVARTYAHELSHGAFALHHTFSANSESFHASEGTTTNLMDYTEKGITLNHKQWTWMHEKHGSGLFGFLADESEGEWTTDGHYYLFTYLGMLMGMDYSEAEKLGRYAEEPDSHIFTKDDGETVKMGNDKDVEVYKNYFEEGDVLPAHKSKLVIHGQNDRYYDAQGREIRFSDDVSSLHEWKEIELKAEDIFNGYVDIKDKIENFSSDLDIENKTFRLYFNSKAIYVAENTTWIIDELQQRNHALSGGYHGVELAVTAYAIKNAAQLGMQQDVQKYLLHRFGDVFAHFQYDGDEANPATDLNKSIRYTDRSLSDYIAALDYFFTHNVKYNVPKFYPYDGKIFEEDGIYQDGDMLYSTFNETDTKIKVIRFLLTTRTTIRRYKPISRDEAIQKADSWYEKRDWKEVVVEHKAEVALGYMEYKTGLKMKNYYRNKLANEHYLLNYSFPEIQQLILTTIETEAPATQNSKVMYGDEATCISRWTSGHAEVGTVPDEILQRPELFMLYVKRAAELLNIINKKDIQSGVAAAVDKIKLAVQWGLDNKDSVGLNARLDGVFSFLIECVKHKNDKEFYVYIPIKFLPDEIVGPIDDLKASVMYSDKLDEKGYFEWDFTRGAENQRGVLEKYLDDNDYYVVEPKIVNTVQDDKNNTIPSYIGLKIRKK